MTIERVKQLRVAQRRMLRKIAQHPKKEEESWISYIKAATEAAEYKCELAGIETWIRAQRRREWRWGGHVARMTDGRWTQSSYWWEPSKGRREVGRPCRSWEYDFNAFFKESGDKWYRIARNREAWKKREEDLCRMV